MFGTKTTSTSKTNEKLYLAAPVYDGRAYPHHRIGVCSCCGAVLSNDKQQCACCRLRRARLLRSY